MNSKGDLISRFLKDCETCEEKLRPQGEWIDYDNTFYKCPECGYLLEKCCPQCQNKVILPKGGIDESDVDCRKCFYLNDKNFCIRNKFPVLNHEAACKHFLYERGKA